ncbi:MAG: SDR family oxidoreductase, partial [Fidelibacterota bacterium]
MRSILITGANRGIGLGLVKHCLSRGDLVFAACRSPEQATELNRLQEAHGDHLHVFPMDVTNQTAMDNAVAMIKAFTGGRLDILFNNAGVGGGKSPLGSVTADELVTAFQVNAVAPLHLAQSCLPLLKKGDRPVIVNITSRMGSIADNGSGGSYAYRASKAALNMLNKSMAIDLASEGI